MSVRLEAISLYLRLRQKPKLARVRSPEAARAAFDRIAARMFRTPADANVMADRMEGPAGPIPVEWISRGRPDRRAVAIYFHGGAYSLGSLATHRHLCAALAGEAGARVMSVDYRLAPEHPWPAAVEDALACYRGLLAAGYEPGRIALCGDSAGGGLAFALLLKAREEGLPDPGAILAFSPWVDLTLNSKSLQRNARTDPLLPVSRLVNARDHYVSAENAGAPTASPLHGDLPNPPPAMIQASRIEILEDEAAAMAEKLRAAGGDVRLEWFRRAPHAWQIFVGMAPEADVAVARAGAFLKSKIARGETAEAA
ncbi:MAG: alpha/beta hydrolase [Pseudomonadota bacterium]